VTFIALSEDDLEHRVSESSLGADAQWSTETGMAGWLERLVVEAERSQMKQGTGAHRKLP
jgi:hypothetical protein